MGAIGTRIRNQVVALAALGMIVPTYANARTPEQAGVTFQIATSDFGINLVVRNETSASLCIPPAMLTANSGSVRAYRNGKEYVSSENTEYPPEVAGAGPFYIASKNSVAVLPIDDTGLNIERGVYTFRVVVAWIDCDRLSANRSYPGSLFKTRLVRSKAFYTPFK